MAKRFVIDNSVTMAWCFSDEESPYAETVLESLEKSEAVAPSIWPLEMGNVLLVAERKKRLSQAAGIRFLSLIKELPILVEQDSLARMLSEIIQLERFK